ncbi:MAG: response regulator [Bacteroidia bacterium]
MSEKINILLVEDNPGDARLIDIYMQDAFEDNYTLEISEDLLSSLNKLKDQNFDIIIADLTLPDSEGLDTFIKIHECKIDTPIIVLTGVEDESIGLNAVKFGAQDFLIKGKIKEKELQRSINYSIERHKLLKELSENSKKLQEKTDALTKEQLKLAEAQKLAHVGSWELNFADLSFIWSDELYRIYGVEPGVFIPTIENFMEFIHPDDKENALNIAKEYTSSQYLLDYYYRIVRSTGEIRVINGRGEPIFDQDGNLIRAIGTAQDVTERVHEEELEKLSLAATKSYNSVIITDSFGKIEWVNEGFKKLTGYTLEDVNSVNELLKRGDLKELKQQKKYYQTIRKNKKPVSYEHKNYAKNGKDFWVITTLTPVLDKMGKVGRIIAIDSDITSRKQMEEELVLANKISAHLLKKGNKALNDLLQTQTQLKETMKVKEQFLANMSHEIRTPMNAIIGFTELIIKTNLSSEQKQYIDAIKISGKNLLIIINDVLDFSKIQSGKVIFEKIEISISKVIFNAINLMVPKTIAKKIELTSEIDPQIPEFVYGDPTRLNQILLNLLGNAIKFTENGKVHLTVTCLANKNEVVELLFSVIDTGIGIPKDKLTTIFEGFMQASNETTRKHGGTGLGLTIVKQLIEQQNGTISVKSNIGEGSTFSFNLFFDKIDAPKTIQQSCETIKRKEIRNLSILLVEDNYLNQLLATKVLTNWNWKVDVAENGLIAIEKLKQNNFDLVLMDIQLPEMDGYEATKYIRHELQSPKSKIPIIAMTAHAFSGEDLKCKEAGMDDYISKPFNEDDLYTKILTILNIKNEIYEQRN